MKSSAFRVQGSGLGTQSVCMRFKLILFVLVLVLEIRILSRPRDEDDEEVGSASVPTIFWSAK
jgi:hypothetical protein